MKMLGLLYIYDIPYCVYLRTLSVGEVHIHFLWKEKGKLGKEDLRHTWARGSACFPLILRGKTTPKKGRF